MKAQELQAELFREVRGLFVLLRSGSEVPRTKELVEERSAAIEVLLERLEPGCLEEGWEALPALVSLRPGAEEGKVE